MIEYIIAQNPDDRIIKKSIQALHDGQLIAFPTDTNWVLAADVASKQGVDQLYRIKGGDKGKHFSLLCDSVSMASNYCMISDFAFRKIKRIIPGPYTFVFPPSKTLPSAIKFYHKDQEIGIRVPNSKLCNRLVNTYGGAIVITSIGTDLVHGENDAGEIYSYQIEDRLGHELAFILDPGEMELLGPSSVVDFSADDGSYRILREGSGDLSTFHS